jgi:hypothetical protein
MSAGGYHNSDRSRHEWPRPPDERGVAMFTGPLDVRSLAELD